MMNPDFASAARLYGYKIPGRPAAGGNVPLGNPLFTSRCARLP